jgi:hypothetical protein
MKKERWERDWIGLDWTATYLEGVLLARIVERNDVETERLAGNALNQHQIGTLQSR